MENYFQSAIRVIQIESQALASLVYKLDSNYVKAIKKILDSSGRIIVSGMGKSGIIGKKIAATLASTGTPSFFMHPGEAYHGDLGMVTPDDIFLAISNSGETDEVVRLLPFLKDNNNYLVALTGNASSTLAVAADCHINVSVSKEACPLQLAPTSSTTATLAMGDAIAITLMEARGFKPENFARFHPGGSLGRRLLSRVEDEMVNNNLPFIDGSSSVLDVIKVITAHSLGLVIVPMGDNYALITDGDIRRAVDTYKNDFFNLHASDLITVNPVHVSVGTRIEDALQLMHRRCISSLLVFDNKLLVGVFKR